MKRRHFISTAVLAAMALPFAIQHADAGAFLFVVLITIVVIGTIFYELWKLCNKLFSNPPPPPPDKKGSNIATGPALDTGGQPTITETFDGNHLPPACFFNIAATTADFLTPDGLTYYTGMFIANVFDSVNMFTGWELTGTITVWMSENFIKIQNADQNGNILSVTTIQGWNNSNPLTLFAPQCQPSPQRFFRMQPV